VVFAVRLRVGGVELGSRDKVFGELRVSRFSFGGDVVVPFVAVTGGREGPVLYVGAGSHGDEVTSVLVALRIGRDLGPDDVDRGAVVIVPVHNPVAVLGKRRWGFVDNLDMNRVWPGDSSGGLSELVARRVFEEFVSRSHYVVDLHTAASDGENVIHAIVPPEGVFRRREGDRFAAVSDNSFELARYFGVGFVARSRLRDERERKYYQHVFGQLHVVAAMHGAPSIVVELGEGGRVSSSAFRAGYDGVLNVGRYLGVLRGEAAEPSEPIVLGGEPRAVRAPRGGIVEVKVGVGERVSRGDVVAYLYTLWDLVEVESPVDGYVVRVRRYGVVEPGERIVVVMGE